MATARRSAPSTVLLKVIMAVTGVILVGFLVTHVLGNLLIFDGPSAVNAYAAKLREVPPLLWGVRAVLLVAAVLHIWSAIKLTLLARASRPDRYVRHKSQAATFASRTIQVGGLLLAVFIVFHILHFTTGTVHSAFVHGDVYHNVTSAFATPWLVVFYMVAMGALGLHLAHGVWSVFHTLGVSNSRVAAVRKPLALVAAIVIAGGFALVPLAVFAGFLR